jgi:hypothetical protein
MVHRHNDTSFHLPCLAVHLSDSAVREVFGHRVSSQSSNDPGIDRANLTVQIFNELLFMMIQDPRGVSRAVKLRTSQASVVR